MMNDLDNFVSARNPPQIANPASNMAIDNLEDRLRNAKDLQDLVRRDAKYVNPEILSQYRVDQDLENFELNLLQLSALLFTDMDTCRLRQLKNAHAGGLLALEQILRAESFVRICLQKLSLPSPPVPFNSEDPLPHHSNTSRTGKVYRSDTESKKVGFRDATCVITGEAEPEKCHWWPFAATETSSNWVNTRELLASHSMFLSRDLRRRLEDLVVPADGPFADELGASDMAWNMICLAPGIHRWMDKAYFAFKWIGETGSTEQKTPPGKKLPQVYAHYQVQWFWLPRTIHNTIQQHIRPKGARLIPRHLVKLDPEEAIHPLAQTLKEVYIPRADNISSTGGAGVRGSAGRIIESGRIFTFKVDMEDLGKTKTVIEAHWLAARMASFSGAADVWDKLDPKVPPQHLYKTAKGVNFPGYDRPRQATETRDEE